MKRSLLIYIICYCSPSAFAQVADSIKGRERFPVAEYFLENDFSPANSLYNSTDTSLSGVRKYFPNNFPYSFGLSNRKLFFSSSSAIGFRSGINDLDLFGYNKEAIKYYRTRTPYTEIFALFGMKKEQFARILHTQNITRQWNIALNMLRIRSEGFYQRQNCTDNNISFSTNYSSKNNRYSVLANALVSSIKADENGGVADDSIFISRLTGNKKLIPVNLMDARTKRRRREVYLKQSVHFGPKENVMKGDSIIGTKIRPTNSLSYSFHANDEQFVYSETRLDSSYYENIFFDSIQTRDSIHSEEFVHGFEFQTTLFKKIKINLGADQKNRRVVQHVNDSTRVIHALYSDQVVHMEIGSAPAKNRLKGLFWKIGKRYILDGDHEGEDHIYGAIGYVFNKNKKLSFDYLSVSHSTPFIYNNYNSNHFLWNNTFHDIIESRVKIKYKDQKNKFSLGAESNQVTGHVYFDSTFSPKQFDNTATIIAAFVQKNLDLGHFNFNNKITWQQSSADVIRIPEFVTNHSIYYEGKWFRKVVDVQLGFDISFHTSYYADAYMPALGHYYIQNEKLIGNYPFVDFFFNMKIKHARIFFKSEHVNAGFMGGNYFLAPHMPGPDRSLKVGIKWMFFD